MTPPQEKHDDDERRQSENTTIVQPPYFQAPPSLTTPPPLPPETYTYLIHALLSLQGSAYARGYPSPYPTLPGHNYPWSLDTAAPTADPSSFYPTNPLLSFTPQSATSMQLPSSPTASPTNPSTVQDPEGTEDTISVNEDKRRRNTAASGGDVPSMTNRSSFKLADPIARFRVKKKIKSLNLERTVTDLTGRAEELEREANDLRRENAWLKEIVLLKGRNLALNLGSQVSRHDGDEKDDCTHAESESLDHGEKGKDKDG